MSIVRWQRHTHVQADSTYYEWYLRNTTEQTPTPFGVVRALFNGEPIHWIHRRPVVLGAPYEMEWTAPTTTAVTTLMGMLRGTHRRVFSRVFGRVN